MRDPLLRSLPWLGVLLATGAPADAGQRSRRHAQPAQLVLRRAAPALPAPVLVSVARKDRARIAGSYRSAALGPIAIDAGDGGRTFVRVNRGERVSRFALPGGVFYAPMLDLWIGFTGPLDAPALQVRSVFHAADARRLAAPAGTP